VIVDVGMIQMAHIGVGISGQEGMQAVNASDYAIGQFRFLQELILVHGRWNFFRLGKLSAYMFYKNLLLTAVQWFFMFVSGHSGQKFLLETGAQLFNVVLTAMPILCLAIFDQDVTRKTALSVPKLYPGTATTSSFGLRVVGFWVMSAFLESFIIFMLISHGMRYSTEHGDDMGLWSIGAIAFTLVVLVANAKFFFHQCRWTVLAACALVLSPVAWFLVALVSSSSPAELFGFGWHTLFHKLCGSAAFWVFSVFATFCSVFFEFALSATNRWLRPTNVQIAQVNLCHTSSSTIR
jgi:phospholipid-transporting ATPase